MIKKLKFALLVLLISSPMFAIGSSYSGQVTYIMVRADGNIAMKIKYNDTDEVYGTIAFSDPEKVKAFYAMALTAKTTGATMKAWKDDNNIFWVQALLQ